MTFMAPADGSTWDGSVLELFDRGVPMHTLVGPVRAGRLFGGAWSVALAEVPCPDAHLHQEVFRCILHGHGPAQCRDHFAFHRHEGAELACCECGEISALFVPLIQSHGIVARGATRTLNLCGAVLCLRCARRLVP